MLLGPNGARMSGVPLIVTKPDGTPDTLQEKSPTDMCDCNYTFAANGFPIQVGGQPSDEISGLALPQHYHVRYFLTFQLFTR